MKDNIFYPDRSAAEAARLHKEWAEFVAGQCTADPILWPDLDVGEAERLCQEGQAFFETAVRRKK